MFGKGQFATLADLRAHDTTGYDALPNRPLALVILPDVLMPPDIYFYNPEITQELAPAVIKSTVGVGGWISRHRIAFIDGTPFLLDGSVLVEPSMPPNQVVHKPISADIVAIVERTNFDRKAIYRASSPIDLEVPIEPTLRNPDGMHPYGFWEAYKTPLEFVRYNAEISPVYAVRPDYPGQTIVVTGENARVFTASAGLENEGSSIAEQISNLTWAGGVYGAAWRETSVVAS